MTATTTVTIRATTAALDGLPWSVDVDALVRHTVIVGDLARTEGDQE